MKIKNLWPVAVVGLLLPFTGAKGDPYQLTDRIICSSDGVIINFAAGTPPEKAVALVRNAQARCLKSARDTGKPCLEGVVQTGPRDMSYSCKAALKTPVLIPEIKPKETKA